jgi:hypothetical protein
VFGKLMSHEVNKRMYGSMISFTLGSNITHENGM